MDPAWVVRPRLLARLDEGLRTRITLLAAPAGFGKTTLAAQWLARQERPVAWLGLDAADSDPERFVRYLVAAVEGATPHRCPKTAALLAARVPPPVGYLCDTCIAELASIAAPLLVVLEDYHAIASDAVQQLLERLVRALPAALHLLVLTRVDPPWPLGRWRTQGWLVELRARDLQFTLAEARQFFAGALHSGLSEPAVARVHAQAEGWAASLRLVALALRDAPDPEARVRAFSGSDRLLADYLTAEVLAAQPPEVRAFLAATAPLPRFCAALCDHLLAARAPQPAACTTLARLEREHLFLVPLDDERRWYRYHHLFRDLLLAHLTDLEHPEGRAAIHRRTAEWFGREGFIEEALRYWIAAGELDAAAAFLGEHLGRVVDDDLSRGELARLLALFPPGAEHGRLPLLVGHAYHKGGRWDLPGLARLCDQIDELQQGSPDRRRSDRDAVLAAAADVHRVGVTFWRGDLQEAVRIAARALDGLPAGRWEFARSVATAYKAVALALSGRKVEGLAELEHAAARGSAGDRRQIAEFLFVQGLIHLYAAQMDMVETVVRRMLAAHAVVPVPDFWLGWAHYLGAVVAYERNQMDAAASEFGKVAKMRYRVTSRLYVDALIGLCLVARARADEGGVTRHATEVRAYALEVGDPTSSRIADSLDARLALDAGGRSASAPAPPPAPDFMSFWLEVPSLTYAEGLLRHPSPQAQEAALPYIERVLAQVEAHHNVRLAIPFSLLRAEALAGLGEQEAALEALGTTVRRAEPLGLVRTFADRGPRLAELLRRLEAERGPAPYLRRLLDACGGLAPSERPRIPASARARDGEPDASAGGAVPDGLSNRELTILRMLQDGLSNKEVAERLFVSPDTVRKHTLSIYRKLGVNKRTKAVVAARSLGLLTSK